MAATAPALPDPLWSAPVVKDQCVGIVASVEQIDAWLAVARAGDRFVYATRHGLPLASAGRRRMLALGEAGIVDLCQKRSAIDPSMHVYAAQRTSKPTALTRPERPVLTAPTAPVADGEVQAIDALLPVLTRFASAGRPCPTDRQLAERAGLREADVPAVLAAMVQSHLIRIQGAAAPTNRRVVILATGAMTGIAK